MLNWELLRNPANWVIVFLMLLIGGIAMTFLHDLAAGEN